MHAILVTVGTDGDIFPYVGLGIALRDRGHRVTLVTAESYRHLATRCGFAFHPFISVTEADEFLAHPDLWHPYRGPVVGARWGVRFIARQYALLAELAHTSDSVLIASPAVMAARIVHDKLGTPMATIILQPWMIASSFEPPLLPGLNLPRWAPSWAGRLYWRMVDAAGDHLVGDAVNQVRVAQDLPPIRRVLQWMLSPHLIVGLFPDWYGRPQPDWPPQMRLAGFPMFDGFGTADSTDDILDFCSAGSPPIAFTLGTGMRHGAEFFQAAVEACRLLGRRGIVVTKFPEQLPVSLPPDIRPCRFAPFQKLFPLCAAVVHHGGIGTTAKALASGTPQLILPLAWDQPDNVLRVKRLGAGDSLGPRKRSGAHLATTLARLLTQEAQASSRSVAMRFAADDALDTVARWLEALPLLSSPAS